MVANVPPVTSQRRELLRPMAPPSSPELSNRLLAWYDRHRRDLPWRAPPGQRMEPYRVWLSEIMLQQTTVAAVIPYFRYFLDRWPDVESLAAAALDEVLHAWQGLGYYARARNLHRCAEVVAREYGGQFPDTEDNLRKLPGIGAYTAAAIAAIAFDRQATVVDGNVERVMARLHAVDSPLPAAKPELKALAAALTPASRAGDYAQAVMDLGATVCTPRNPQCGQCPCSTDCRAFALGSPAAYPRRAPKKERPTRFAAAYWAVSREGRVLFRRRPENGLLGGMMEIPSSPWGDSLPAQPDAQAPFAADWRRLPGEVEHGFTHFRIIFEVYAAIDVRETEAAGVWKLPREFGDLALPTMTKKVVRHALARATTGQGLLL